MVVGGGHNGLVAAAYLGRAGRSVLVLERAAQVGGAAVSRQVFDGVDVRLSAYSYLVSLLPDRIVADLGLELRLTDRVGRLLHGHDARRPAGGPAGRARRGPGHGHLLPAADRRRRRVRRLAALLRPAGDAGRGPRPDADRAAAGGGRPRRPAAGPRPLARPARPAARRRRRRPPHRRRRPRDRAHRRPDRHVRRRPRGRRPRRPLLPLPPDRQRHRPLAGARRRHGRGERRHGGRRPQERRGAGHPGHGDARSTRARTASPCTGPTRTAPSRPSTPATSSAAPRRACWPS